MKRLAQLSSTLYGHSHYGVAPQTLGLRIISTKESVLTPSCKVAWHRMSLKKEHVRGAPILPAFVKPGE